ncbi:hypothetical protein B0O99DRAFT_166017 [Bisporella sp. PMI_857]|nr:hypothetical protein B0O99DRAFT_166017 [Bisporella sp. PMI_857]
MEVRGTNECYESPFACIANSGHILFSPKDQATVGTCTQFPLYHSMAAVWAGPGSGSLGGVHAGLVLGMMDGKGDAETAMDLRSSFNKGSETMTSHTHLYILNDGMNLILSTPLEMSFLTFSCPALKSLHVLVSIDRVLRRDLSRHLYFLDKNSLQEEISIPYSRFIPLSTLHIFNSPFFLSTYGVRSSTHKTEPLCLNSTYKMRSKVFTVSTTDCAAEPAFLAATGRVLFAAA